MRLAPLLFALFTGSVQAHELWLERQGERWTLKQGHQHGGHAGEKSVPYAAGFVRVARCLDAGGATRPLAIASPSPWTASGACAALHVEVSSGYWSKTPWETKNAPKNETPGALKSWLSRDTLLFIDNRTAIRPHGEGLEILPEGDPFALKPGDKLVVRVTQDGKPLAGAPVAYRGHARGATDSAGRIAIRLRTAGTQLISASTELPLADGKADVEIRAATLQFELPK